MKNLSCLNMGVIAIGGMILSPGAVANKGPKANLLFIMTDQQRFDALSIAGNKVVTTPNLDRLAKQGAWFRNAYTQCAVCAPTRASILTGCTVENHRILTNEVSSSTKESGRMPMPTFDELLNKSGYRCEYFGKWHSPEFHAEVYQNPVLKTKSGKSVFSPGGLPAHYLDYLDPLFPKQNNHPGELYDTFTKRIYKPNPLDKHFGMTVEAVNNLTEKFPQCDLHGELTIPAESKVINALYNMREDPHEMNNLLGSNPDRLKYEEKTNELKNDILTWLKQNKSGHYDGVKARKLL